MPSFWILASGEQQAGVSLDFVSVAIDAGELCAQEMFFVIADKSLEEFILRSKPMPPIAVAHDQGD